MSTTSVRRRAVLLGGSLGALILLGTPASACRDTSVVEEADDDWTMMENALRILATGDPAAKRTAAEEASDVFDVLAYDDKHDEEDAARVIASLRSLLRVETDDWISYRLLTKLHEVGLDSLQPLFLDALKDRSPNLRWLGARWFTSHTDAAALPELDDAWRHEDRPWAQADLMIALVLHGSRDHWEEFVRLARGKDPRLGAAAVRALAIIGDPHVIPLLAILARTSRSDTGLVALDALALWPDSREALETVIEASRSPRLDFQRHAAAALENFEDPAAPARLFAIASGRGDPQARGAALTALKRADPAALLPLAMAVLHEAPTQENEPLYSAAIGVLRRLDDPSILPGLADLDFKITDGHFHEIRRLVRHLSRERDPEGAKPEQPPSDPMGFLLDMDDEETQTIFVTAPPSTLTIRCWKAPDVPGDPQEFPRLPAGSEEEILDHFERGEASWVQIDTDDCWIPSSSTDTSHPPAKPSGKKETSMPIRREFDLPADEVESDVAQGLMDAGLLEVIEPGDEVIGVALTIDAEDFDQVFLLARSCGLNETMLDGEIYHIVSEMAPLHSGHPALERFRKGFEARRTETDEVLDIEELYDH